MKIDQYCQQQRCKHIELEQFVVCFLVTQVCQRQLGFLVLFVVLTGALYAIATSQILKLEVCLYNFLCICQIVLSNYFSR